ncbi:MAG: hypothetical protein LBG79_04805 [Spirochaetaceae bacterium]|jgi:hypothetical protein|nr:hypothetical protein [Spirochaetaceae bacterium]GMO27211.1 MAG: hypothetical protein Pg6A_14730 [Termitinemataceae bacterium]
MEHLEFTAWIEEKRKEAQASASAKGREIVGRVCTEAKNSCKPAFSESLREANRARTQNKK